MTPLEIGNFLIACDLQMKDFTVPLSLVVKGRDL